MTGSGPLPAATGTGRKPISDWLRPRAPLEPRRPWASAELPKKVVAAAARLPVSTLRRLMRACSTSAKGRLSVGLLMPSSWSFIVSSP